VDILLLPSGFCGAVLSEGFEFEGVGAKVEVEVISFLCLGGLFLQALQEVNIRPNKANTKRTINMLFVPHSPPHSKVD
jgi:hypothetical protein